MKKMIAPSVALATFWLAGCLKRDGNAWVACQPAGEWSTSEAFQHTSLQNAASFQLSEDSSGRVFAIGKGDNGAAASLWIVRKSVDAGVTWDKSDVYQLSSGQSAFGYGIYASSTVVIAVGQGLDAGGVGHWIVRLSDDHGESWQGRDNYALSSGENAQAKGIGEDADGNLYVVGQAVASGGAAHWITRKSANAGLTWTTVDNYQYDSANDSGAVAFLRDASGALYVVGTGNDSDAVEHWIARKSENKGSTWTTIDDFQLANGFNADATSITKDLQGHIFVAGYAMNATGIHSVVRKSTDGGDTWTRVDDHQFTSGLDTYAQGITLDAFGSLFSAGYYTDAGGKDHALIRKSTDGGLSWTTHSSYQWINGQNTKAVSVQAHGGGHLFASGLATDLSGNTRWITQKLACQ